MIRSHASLFRLLLLLMVVLGVAAAVGGFSWDPDAAAVAAW
jgi:hypothetical protein